MELVALITEGKLRKLLSQKKLPNPYPLQAGDQLTPSAKDFLHSRKIKLNKTASSKLEHESEPSFPLIPVGVSNRHVHLSAEDMERLFGKDQQLTAFKELSQPGHFAANEKVAIVGGNYTFHHVRILGPFREQTQIEISKTDSYLLGIHPPVRLSGDIKNSVAVSLVGPKGSVTVTEGLIIAKNHVHMSKDDAKKFEVVNGERLILMSLTNRRVIFTDVPVRVDERYQLEFHIDRDEANATLLKTGDFVKVIGKNNQLYFNALGDVADG